MRSYFFDAESFRLLKWEGTRKVGDKEVLWESLFRDYREVNGLQFAFEIDSDAVGTEQSQKIIADTIEVDPHIDESRFGKPCRSSRASTGRCRAAGAIQSACCRKLIRTTASHSAGYSRGGHGRGRRSNRSPRQKM